MSSTRIYEVMFVLSPNTEEEHVDKIIGQLSQIVADKGGAVNKVEKMGRRRLAYDIRKGNTTYREGYYVLLVLHGSGAEIFETERRLRVLDPVIRFITVRIDEDLKRAKKIQNQRAARATAHPEGAGGDEAFEDVEGDEE